MCKSTSKNLTLNSQIYLTFYMFFKHFVIQFFDKKLNKVQQRFQNRGPKSTFFRPWRSIETTIVSLKS